VKKRRPSDAPVKLRLLTEEDRSEWLRLLSDLYPDSTEADHVPAVDAYLFGRPTDELVPSAVFGAEPPDGGLCGFLELSVRNYAEGCAGDTPYVESWFVDENRRDSGVGRLLMRSAEEWSRRRGYTELASDALLDNPVSHAAHRALGFQEVERTVHYRKGL
jgi:aminoglycoside 6'-N-acetyltransferase I